MARLVSLLVILSVLWCGLHLLEPAGTVAGLVDVAHAEELAGDRQDGRHEGEGAGKVAHSGHHHCPVAPAPRIAAAEQPCPAPERLFFPAAANALPSLAQAPPLEPPVA